MTARRPWLLALLFAACAHAPDTAGSSRISGTLVDETGAPLAGIELRVRDIDGAGRQILTSADDGSFELTYLLDAHGRQRRLERGDHLALTAWRAGLEPRTLDLRFPGGSVVLQPLVLPVERLEIPPEPIERLLGGGAGVPPAGGSRSGRGE